MDLFQLIALLVIVSSICAYINARFLKLPGTIGIMTIAIMLSIIIIVIDSLNPGVARYLTALAKNINFTSTLLNIMLGFLLFSSSFNLNTKRLKREMRPVFILSTIGVIISTGLFGGLFYIAGLLFNISIPLIYCFLFGALISPTDPVAVGAILKDSKLSVHLETIISGESLFNDGIGLVLFVTILEIIKSGKDNINIGDTLLLFAQEVFGGIILGLVLGYIAYILMKSIKDFQTIVLVSLGLVMSISVLATLLDLSIPLAVVFAGLFAGDKSINTDWRDHSHESLEKFWLLIDEMLNTILFVMIGLQMINLPFLNNYWLIGGIAIVVILIARWFSIALPITFLKQPLKITYRQINILTWAGLRGGISIALALSLPYGPYRHIILAGSYFVVIFSVIVQGLTLNRLINFLLKKDTK